MSQVMCLGCKKKIDTSADPCPHCGRKDAGREGLFFHHNHECHNGGWPSLRNFYNELDTPIRVWQLRWGIYAAIAVAGTLVIWLGFFAAGASDFGLSVFWGLVIAFIAAELLQFDVNRCPACKGVYMVYKRRLDRQNWGSILDDSNKWCPRCGQPFFGWWNNDYHKDRELRDAEGNTPE